MDRVRRLVVALVVLVVVGVVVLVVMVRPGLRDDADGIDRAWQPLVTPLSQRYTTLAGVRDALKAAGVGDRDVVLGLTQSLERWAIVRTGTDAEEQVVAANRLEALAARADALVNTPRLLLDPTLGVAFAAFTKTRPTAAQLTAYNRQVERYQGQRDGFWSRIVASLDGYPMRPTLQLVA